ncbi:MAG: type III secretion system stator protein SctL [Steroidobacteraceae bacterium]
MGLVVLIDRPGYKLAADRKIVKSEELSVVARVAEAYARAQQQIAELRAGAQAALAKRMEEGYREGLAQAQQLAAQRLTFTEVDRLTLLRSLQPALAEVVVDAVALLAKGIERQALIGRALETLQSSLREASWARLHVHPDAAAAAQAALAEFDRETGLGKLARVVADAALPADGCVLESEFGKVDASLATQLQIIHGAIARAAAYVLAAMSTPEGDGNEQ